MKNVNFSLSENFEFVGNWWLPDFPDQKVPGRITYNAHDSIILELTGVFEQIDDDSEIHPKIILGFSTEGHEITLVDNLFLGTRRIYPGIHSQRFHSKYLLIGHQFKSENDLLFTSYAVSYEYLEEWYGQNLFKSDLLKNDDDDLSGYNVKFERPNPKELPIPSKEGSLSITFTFSNSEQRRRSYTIHDEAFLLFRPVTPKDLHWYTRVFFDIERFLILAIVSVTFPRRIRGFIEVGERHLKRVDVFRVQEKRTFTDIYQWEMLFTYPQVAQKLSKILDNWLLNVEEARPVYDLFFSYLYKPDNYLEFKFLGLTQALESFHRVTKGGKYLPDEDYKKHRRYLEKCLPEAITGGWRQSFKVRLKYGNEYSLSKRLKDLLADLEPQIIQLVCSNSNQFISSIVNTRNYYTHYDKNLKEESLSFQEMIVACKQMQILLTILFLKRLEFNNSTILESISKNKRLKL